MRRFKSIPVITAFRCLVAALLLGLPAAARAQTARVTDCWMTGTETFSVEAETPSGAQFASLESSADGVVWKTQLSTALDGRRSRVTFRMPRPDGARAMARVRTGPGSAPAAEYPESSRITVFPEPQLVSDQAKIDLLNAAGPKMQGWRSLAPAQYSATLAAWARTSPIVSGAAPSMLSPTTVFVQFRDGEISTLYQRRRVEEAAPTPRAAALRRSPRSGSAGQEGPPGGLPGSSRAVCAYSLEPHIFPNSAPTVAGWLSSAGYDTQTYTGTTVDDILSWGESPLGVLYWQAHGTPYAKDGVLGGLEGVSLVTLQPATATGRIGKYSGMLRRGEMSMSKDDSAAQPCYSITSSFVRSYLKFAPHSFVALDVCYGAREEIASAFPDSGAGAVVSWDLPSGISSGSSMLKIFDRLLGMNAEPPVSIPGERPFSLPAVRAWMQMRGYDLDPSPPYANQTDFNARLVWYAHGTAPAHILRPSIMRVLFEGGDATHAYTRLLVEGDFGRDPGASLRRLTWAGREIRNLEWREDGIVIRPPVDQPAGSLQLTMRGRHISNERPVTEWNLPVEYVHHGLGSLTYRMNLSVKLRADIAGTRGMPEMPVQYLPVTFWHLNDSRGTLTASGSYSPDPDTTIAWSGGSQLRSFDPEEPGSNLLLDAIAARGRFNLQSGSVEEFAVQATGRFTETVTGGGASEVIAGTPILLYPPPPLKLNLGSSALSAESRSLTAPDGTTATASWPQTRPLAAPAPDTLR